jgi:DNA helicase II / ATP-dependent DNA helicase PcrA
MTSRIGQPDTDADRELRECLDQQSVRSFIMVAGAGSGKTTSLVKALNHLARPRGAELQRRGQRIACITYTEVAAVEIWNDVGNVPLFHISTIHSFLWTVVSPFQVDLRGWVSGRIGGKIAEAEERIARPRTQARTRVRLATDIERYRRELVTVDSVPSFKYGTGSDYAMGILGHDDILKVGTDLIDTKPLLRSLVASRFPFILIDESQDTWPVFVDALRCIEESVGAGFCLGFFGDPMQKIYLTGVGSVTPGATWNEITKPENFRCPTRVLDVINHIRAEDDGLLQVPGRTAERDGPSAPAEGTAHIFILPTDDQRSVRLDQVRRWLATQNDDPLWRPDLGNDDVRMLVLVHRMAATRLGFPNVYSALNDGAPASFKSGLRDGTVWVLRPFLTYLLHLVLAFRSGVDFDVIAMLRVNCPLLSRDRLASENIAVLLRKLGEAVRQVTAMFDNESNSTIRDVISFVRDQDLAALDSRFLPYIDDHNLEYDDDEERAEQAAVTAFLNCRAAELWGYRTYIEGLSPFSTQQDVKGAEFQRVLVVLDDEESDYNLFSYGKYFGITPLSDKDTENLAEGVDSVLGRTRRLFYVCCSRALRDLAVVFFVPNVAAARTAIGTRNFFPAHAIHDVESLNPSLSGACAD